MQYQTPAEGAYDKLKLANNMRIAHELAGMGDDGHRDRLYAEQVTAMDYEKINEQKIATALPAAQEAYTTIKSLTAEDIAAMSEDEIHEYQTRANLVEYVLNSHELTYKVFQRKQDRYEAVGVEASGWMDKFNDLHDMFNAEMKRRIDAEFSPANQPSPWGNPGR